MDYIVSVETRVMDHETGRTAYLYHQSVRCPSLADAEAMASAIATVQTETVVRSADVCVSLNVPDGGQKRKRILVPLWQVDDLGDQVNRLRDEIRNAREALPNKKQTSSFHSFDVD